MRSRTGFVPNAIRWWVIDSDSLHYEHRSIARKWIDEIKKSKTENPFENSKKTNFELYIVHSLRQYSTQIFFPASTIDIILGPETWAIPLPATTLYERCNVHFAVKLFAFNVIISLIIITIFVQNVNKKYSTFFCVVCVSGPCGPVAFTFFTAHTMPSHTKSMNSNSKIIIAKTHTQHSRNDLTVGNKKFLLSQNVCVWTAERNNRNDW